MIKLSTLILESKQGIVNLGYPEIIASILYEKFGNLATLMAKWYREFKTSKIDKNWFRDVHYRTSNHIGLFDMVNMYYYTDTPEHYFKERKRLGLDVGDYTVDDISPEYLRKQKILWKNEITQDFLASNFFTRDTLITDIINKSLKDIAPYKHLTFWQAILKYDERRIFKDKVPLKVYDDGYKWINVGSKCHLMGHYMSNCGSSGLMSGDKDRTLLGLFDVNNKPHVIVTYSPNEKRISGDEGPGYSEVKSKYHDYVLDLAKLLGANFDIGKSKSKSLSLKYRLKDKGSNLKRLDPYCTSFDEYFRFNMGSDVYYTNCYEVISLEDMKKIRDAIKEKKIKFTHHPKNIIEAAFDSYNKPATQSIGVKYLSFYDLLNK